jgi:hypothetical protein
MRRRKTQTTSKSRQPWPATTTLLLRSLSVGRMRCLRIWSAVLALIGLGEKSNFNCSYPGYGVAMLIEDTILILSF